MDGRKNIGVNQQQTQGGEEEEEISPPPDVKEEGKEKQKEKDDDGHRCNKCGKSFGRLSLLNRYCLNTRTQQNLLRDICKLQLFVFLSEIFPSQTHETPLWDKALGLYGESCPISKPNQ